MATVRTAKMRSRRHQPGHTTEAFTEVIVEAHAQSKRRAQGKFDGLLGTLPRDTAGLIQRIAELARDALLSEFDEAQARTALEAHQRGSSHHGSLRADLALAILGAILSAQSTKTSDCSTLVELAGLDANSLLMGAAGRATRKAQHTGGAENAIAAKKVAAVGHAVIVTEARRLLAAKQNPRNIVGVIARSASGGGLTTHTIRGVLQAAGVLLPRQKRKVG